MDGTHVQARLPPEDAIPYFGRKGYHTQNILAVCDFDMCFTFVSAGWEGSMHDTRVFYNVVMDPNKNFPHPEGGMSSSIVSNSLEFSLRLLAVYMQFFL